MLKNHCKHVEKMENAETMKKCRQKLDPIPCHPNNYTDILGKLATIQYTHTNRGTTLPSGNQTWQEEIH